MNLLISICLLFIVLTLLSFVYCAIILNGSISKMQREIEIKNAYFYLIYSIADNYTQYDDTEYTKEMVNQLSECAVKGNNNDDSSLFYEDFENNKQYNVLMEEIQRK